MRMILDAAVVSDTGRVRQNNEDNFYLRGMIRQVLTQGHTEERHKGSASQALFAGADGMGGEENGELASLVTVQALKPCGLDEVRDTALDCIGQANRMICEEIADRGGRRMGSTLAALYIDRGNAVCCNVGDSRVYLMRDGELKQLSEDHTKVQQMVRMGALTPEQARTHKSRHILMQNIGIFEDEMVIEPYFSREIKLKKGDVFLLCSDGLTDMLDDGEIEALLTEGDCEGQAKALVEQALKNGGRDNVTVMVVQVRGGFGVTLKQFSCM